MRRKTLVIVCLLVIALMVASAIPVGAKGKPPKDPPPDGGDDPTGTIFFHINDDSGSHIYTMNADGSSKTLQVQYVAGMQAMSLQTHNGHYWYIGFVQTTGTHPDDTFQTQLWAFSDDGSNSVMLLDDTTMAYDTWNGPPVWLTGDAFISWAALKWGVDDEVAEAGIYKAAITFATANGDPEITTPTLQWSTPTYFHKGYGEYTPDASYPNWTADMTKIVFSSPTNGVTVVDLSTVPATVTIIGNGLGVAQFSPDGSKLLHGVNGVLYVMDIDGSSRTAIVTPRDSKKTSKYVAKAYWSPDSKFIVYTIMTINRMNRNVDATIFAIGADGSGNSGLTNSINDQCWSREWR